MYLEAIEGAFGSEIDYAQLVKLYGQEFIDSEKRYSPAECIASEKHIVQGNPDVKAVSTSYVERQNLTMRMGMRRFTRLTNGFSKKIEFQEYAIALHYMHYNFCRIHKSLTPKNSIGVTPAMTSGLTNRIWTIEDLINLIE